ncbi:MAG: hypothetical protein IJ519_03955 [Clostridia bacterium]|nr:hypothetical protein [Clostridia bacterium]
MKKYLNIIVGVLCCILISGAFYYAELPPLNPQSTAFWGFTLVVILSFSIPFGLISAVRETADRIKKRDFVGFSLPTSVKVILGVVAVPVLVLVIGGAISSTFFNARGYASVITVQSAVFEEDMPEVSRVDNIALMDSASAQIYGNRTLGSLSEVVSQYEAGNTYNQINYLGSPKKVTSLEYVDFFKWWSNRGDGIPGYIMVDPVGSSAEYVELSRPLRYVDSAYFNDDLMRKLRVDYPTKIFGSVSFEIDEEGTPYYIVSCMSAKIGLFGAMDVSEVIIFDPADGTSELYNVSETPSWIDEVYTGQLATAKYDWYGMYSGGYWNSVVGNKDCKKTTDDFGYITLGDDVWYFTGVTSIVSDESNIGFLLSNARTGEYKFYPVVGAEEYSAMSAAEGEVQEKGYTASFPSLVNVSGEATYILVLKDAGGIVKQYALVNVENYSIVATGATQQEAMNAYRKELSQNGIKDEGSVQTKRIVVSDVRIATIDGNSFVYLTDNERKVFKGSIVDDESLMTIRVGDGLELTYTEIGYEDVYLIEKWQPTDIPTAEPEETPAE